MGFNYLLKNIEQDDRLLIVDDVFDTGRTIEVVIWTLRGEGATPTHRARSASRCRSTSRRATAPPVSPITTSTRPRNGSSSPHSLEGLTPEEIARHRPALLSVLREAGGDR